MKGNLLLILFLITIFCSCSSDKDEPSLSDEPTTSIEGASTDFNQWIYSHMNHYYLWREDMPDSLECDYTIDPVSFYKNLFSPKDRFSYCSYNKGYNPSRIQDLSKWGFAYQLYKDNSGNTLYQVLYVQSRQLKAQGLKRGDLLKLKESNSISTTFYIVEYRNRELQIKKEIITETLGTDSESNTILLDSIYNIKDKNIGYLCYLQFDGKQDLTRVINQFYVNGIDELVLDLRYNPGGLVSTCRYLCNCIVPEQGYCKIFQQHSFNEVYSEEVYRETGDYREYSYFERPPEYTDDKLGTKLYPLKLSRIYVLTSQHTASASEATINSLKPYMDVVVIGEQTTGKGVGMFTLSSPEYKYALVPITFRYYNALGETVPDEGIVPDYYVPDGYSTLKREIGDIEEPLLRQALTLICPDIFDYMPMGRASHIEQENNYLTPVGEPSYITEFKQKQYLYENN
ncbi:MAG: hypothetical protein IJ328_01015 [Muribaculaceae bacterium]|nr:hypothetical protein [Muribaculaceae bacterium]